MQSIFNSLATQRISLPTEVFCRRARVLLVDDEPQVTRGLTRSLYTLCPDWEVHSCAGADEALQFLKTMHVDVLVSDLHMPRVHGAAFLEEVRHHYPAVLRFVLSGEAKPSIFLNASNLALQCLPKPCEASELVKVIQNALAEIASVRDAKVKTFLSQLMLLPMRSNIQRDVLQLLSDEKTEISQIVESIKSDPSTVLRVLKIANSPFYGHGGNVNTLDDAIALIGLDSVASMVTTLKLFETSMPMKASNLNVDVLWEHCVQVSAYCRFLAPRLKIDQATQREAITSAMLHDVGKLILAIAVPESFNAAAVRARADHIPLWQAEYPIFGNHHAEVGACLLHLWGLPQSIVNVVAFHHTPHRLDKDHFGPVTLVHVADALANENSPGGIPVLLDSAHLATLGLPESISEWKDMLPRPC